MSLPYRRLAIAACALFGIGTAQCLLASPPDSTHTDTTSSLIFYIGNLNADSIPDTLSGYIAEPFQYRPGSIHWGSAPAYDSLTRLPIEQAHSTTLFRYPRWRDLSVSLAVERLNDDSLPDIVLYMRGRVRSSVRHDSDPSFSSRTQPAAKTGLLPLERDTVLAVAIFAQKNLDTNAILNVSEIQGVQRTPFLAMQLRFGSELNSPAVRDLSGRTSYVLARVPANEILDSVPKPGAQPRNVQPTLLHVFPNPASLSASVVSENLPAGTYTVELISEDGALRMRRTSVVGDNGNLLQRLEASRLPKGYYTVRVYSKKRLIGTHPFIITR